MMDETMKRANQWIRLAGWLVIVLGIIHVAATPLIFSFTPDFFTDEDAKTSLFMFVMTGIAVIFSGWIIRYSEKGWRLKQRWAWEISRASAIFLLFLGIGAIISMPQNPFSYLCLMIALVAAIPVWIYRKMISD